MPATAQEVLLRFRLDLHNALEQALFFGAGREELYAAAEAELRDALADHDQPVIASTSDAAH